MIKYILTLYVTINGNCYQDKIMLWGSSKEFHVVGKELNIHAVSYFPERPSTQYQYYQQGDTIIAVNHNFNHGFYVTIQGVNKKFGVLLTNHQCNGEL